MGSPSELGHVHLKVRDVDRSIAFYTAVVGLTVTQRIQNFVFLSFGKHHHDLALQGLGADVEGPSSGVGLYHVAFEVEDEKALRDTYRTLLDRDVIVTPVDHGISKALYFDDPDGNGVEVYLDTREKRGTEAWDGVNERFDPETL